MVLRKPFRMALLGIGVITAVGLAGCGSTDRSGAAEGESSAASVSVAESGAAGASPEAGVSAIKGWEPIPGSTGTGSDGAGSTGGASGNAAGNSGHGNGAASAGADGAGEKDTAGDGDSGSGAAGNMADSADTDDPDAVAENATADDEAGDAAEGGGTSAAGAADTSGVETSLVKSSSAELTGLMNSFMAEHGLHSGNFAAAYENLATGETYYYNELHQWDAASTYKLPLNLLYYDMQAAGEISADTIIPGTNTPLSECHHQSLEFSNNPLSEAMMDNLGSYDQVKQRMRRYFTLTDAETDNSYYHHNYFCARQMMDCAKYVYDHQGQYQEALGYLEAAQPGMYFRKYIPGVTIAQKYGQRDGYEHTAGIVFGRVPFVLSVYSYQGGSEPMIGSCAKLFYDYTEE